jgi:Holliday junction resolvase RusA-like endonuclease
MTAGPITVVLDGAPVPKARARFGVGHTYTPQKTRDYERGIGWAAKIAMGGRPAITGVVRVTALFELPIPASWPKARRAAAINGDISPAAKPDLDNFLKSALDAINGIAVADDAQVVEIAARKIYGVNTKSVITISPLTENAS